MSEVKKTHEPKQPLSKWKKLQLGSIGLMVVGGVLLSYSLLQLSRGWNKTHAPVSTKIPTAVNKSTDSPDETQVDVKTAEFNVAPDMPRILHITSIGAEGFIQQVDIDQHQAVAVPSNVHFAGWYTASVRPGDAGLSIIDGHVQGVYQPGIFKRLGETKVGSSFSIEFGNGKRKKFVVVSSKDYSVEEANKQLFQKDPTIVSQLNLITCGGAYQKSTHSYDKRIIVVAKATS